MSKIHKKLSRFEDMTVWQEAQELAVLVYKITKTFPAEEKYSLIDQLRRAASSVSANIAEVFGRHINKDRTHFYTIALGSLLETKNFIYLSARLNYLTSDDASSALKETESIHKQITATQGYFKKHV